MVSQYVEEALLFAPSDTLCQLQPIPAEPRKPSVLNTATNAVIAALDASSWLAGQGAQAMLATALVPPKAFMHWLQGPAESVLSLLWPLPVDERPVEVHLSAAVLAASSPVITAALRNCRAAMHGIAPAHQRPSTAAAPGPGLVVKLVMQVPQEQMRAIQVLLRYMYQPGCLADYTHEATLLLDVALLAHQLGAHKCCHDATHLLFTEPLDWPLVHRLLALQALENLSGARTATLHAAAKGTSAAAPLTTPKADAPRNPTDKAKRLVSAAPSKAAGGRTHIAAGNVGSAGDFPEVAAAVAHARGRESEPGPEAQAHTSQSGNNLLAPFQADIALGQQSAKRVVVVPQIEPCAGAAATGKLAVDAADAPKAMDTAAHAQPFIMQHMGKQGPTIVINFGGPVLHLEEHPGLVELMRRAREQAIGGFRDLEYAWNDKDVRAAITLLPFPALACLLDGKEQLTTHSENAVALAVASWIACSYSRLPEEQVPTVTGFLHNCVSHGLGMLNHLSGSKITPADGGRIVSAVAKAQLQRQSLHLLSNLRYAHLTTSYLCHVLTRLSGLTEPALLPVVQQYRREAVEYQLSSPESRVEHAMAATHSRFTPRPGADAKHPCLQLDLDLPALGKLWAQLQGASDFVRKLVGGSSSACVVSEPVFFNGYFWRLTLTGEKFLGLSWSVQAGGVDISPATNSVFVTGHMFATRRIMGSDASHPVEHTPILKSTPSKPEANALTIPETTIGSVACNAQSPKLGLPDAPAGLAMPATPEKQVVPQHTRPERAAGCNSSPTAHARRTVNQEQKGEAVSSSKSASPVQPSSNKGNGHAGQHTLETMSGGAGKMAPVVESAATAASVSGVDVARPADLAAPYVQQVKGMVHEFAKLVPAGHMVGLCFDAGDFDNGDGQRGSDGGKGSSLFGSVAEVIARFSQALGLDGSGQGDGAVTLHCRLLACE